MCPKSVTATARYRCWLISALLLSACSTGGPSLEGEYHPGCPSFAGNTIRLEGGNYVWEKFTDAVEIGPDGQIVNPFPGFPRRGRYRINGDALYLESENTDVRDTFYIRKHAGEYVLLTATELAAAEKSGLYGNCVLTRSTD